MNREVLDNPVTGEIAISLDGGTTWVTIELTDDGTQAVALPRRPNDPEWVSASLVTALADRLHRRYVQHRTR